MVSQAAADQALKGRVQCRRATRPQVTSASNDDSDARSVRSMVAPSAAPPERAARNAASTSARIAVASGSAQPNDPASLAASAAAVGANRSSAGKLAEKASGPTVLSVSAIGQPILNRNPPEKCLRFLAVLRDLPRQSACRLEGTFFP